MLCVYISLPFPQKNLDMRETDTSIRGALRGFPKPDSAYQHREVPGKLGWAGHSLYTTAAVTFCELLPIFTIRDLGLC